MKAAFFAPVEEEWIDRAEDYLENKEKLYFVTNSNMARPPDHEGIDYVYFKLKGSTEIGWKADFVEICTNNPKDYRLAEGGEEGRFCSGFKNLRRLNDPVGLEDLEVLHHRQESARRYYGSLYYSRS